MSGGSINQFIQGITGLLFGQPSSQRPQKSDSASTEAKQPRPAQAEAAEPEPTNPLPGNSVLPRINRSALVEMTVFLAGVILLDFMFGDGTRFINAPLHPFWIIILLVTVQYGPIEALIAALLSSAVLLVGNLPEQSLSETMYQYLLRVTLTPILWIMTALILGSIRARQRAEHRNLLSQLWKSEKAAEAIIENYKSAKQSKERLELRLAEERCSVLTVYEVAKSLETLDPAAAMDGFEKLVRTALNPKKFSFFHWRGNTLVLDAAYGWEKTDGYEDHFHGNTSLASQVVRDKRVLSIIREEDEKGLNGQGMLAGPIVDEETGKIFGMLKIEETGFTDLGIRTHETFRIVCAWIARVCTNIEKYGEPAAKPASNSKSKKRRQASVFSLAEPDEAPDTAA